MRRVGLLVGSFHWEHMQAMVASAREMASEHDLQIITEVRVPGSMEKPLAAQRLLSRGDIDGLIVLGIIEKGETQHGQVMAEAVIHHLIALQLEFSKPMGIGILGPDVARDQMLSRLVPYARNAVGALAAMLDASAE